jgi:hypothetical protein
VRQGLGERVDLVLAMDSYKMGFHFDSENDNYSSTKGLSGAEEPQ